MFLLIYGTYNKSWIKGLIHNVKTFKKKKEKKPHKT